MCGKKKKKKKKKKGKIKKKKRGTFQVVLIRRTLGVVQTKFTFYIVLINV